MLKAGDIVSSLYFPEVVEIKKCESIEAFYIVEAVGEDTNQFYNLMIERKNWKNFIKCTQKE